MVGDGGGGGGLQDFSVSPSSIGPNWVFELGCIGLDWVGVGPRSFGEKVLGTGLDNEFLIFHTLPKDFC